MGLSEEHLVNLLIKFIRHHLPGKGQTTQIHSSDAKERKKKTLSMTEESKSQVPAPALLRKTETSLGL